MQGNIENLDKEALPLLYDERQVMELLGVSRTTLFRHSKNDLFPRYFYLNSDKKSGKRWFTNDIHDYIRRCAERSGIAPQENKEKIQGGSNNAI